LSVLTVAALLIVTSAQAQTFSVIYAFKGSPNDGDDPSGVVFDDRGDMYGTTYLGGAFPICANGCGTVFKLDRSGTETVLQSFSGMQDGGVPEGVAVDSAGTLYGTTLLFDLGQSGTVFRLTRDGILTVLHNFCASMTTDGCDPFAPPIVDEATRALYGTTVAGGPQSGGTVFKLKDEGGESLLHSFDGLDGDFPQSALVRDIAGNSYGTASFGGSYPTDNCNPNGCGTVYKLDKHGQFVVLHSFSGREDGGHPEAGLTLDREGNLYGTATIGGSDPNCSCGVVFKLDRQGRLTVLHTFTGAEGSGPIGGLALDERGNLYGTAFEGGVFGNGTLFMLSPSFMLSQSGLSWKFAVLHNFAGGADGAFPESGLVWHHGSVYGTTRGGGDMTCSDIARNGCGTIFKFTPSSSPPGQ
jgi:uncharacterized repeat protein (TIGR03803 family)